MITSHELDLLEALREGHRDAFSRLYEEYYGPLLLAAYKRLKDHKAANEIVQDMFLEIWERKTFMTVEVSLTSMLYTILARKTGRYIQEVVAERKKKDEFIHSVSLVSYEVDMRMQQFLGDACTPEDLYEINCRRLKKALNKLPPQQYVTVQMVHFEHLPYKIVAESLSVTLNTVKTNLRKATKKMKRLLNSNQI